LAILYWCSGRRGGGGGLTTLFAASGLVSEAFIHNQVTEGRKVQRPLSAAGRGCNVAALYQVFEQAPNTWKKVVRMPKSAAWANMW